MSICAINETFPSKNKFNSLLSGKGISYKQYKHVFKVSKKFGMKMMKDHHYLHLKCDVLLLDDVFEKFRNRCFENYGLCPSH